MQSKPYSLDCGAYRSKTNAVLHVYFNDVGVYSGCGLVDYLPKVNLEGHLFYPKDSHYLQSWAISYGVKAKEVKSSGDHRPCNVLTVPLALSLMVFKNSTARALPEGAGSIAALNACAWPDGESFHCTALAAWQVRRVEIARFPVAIDVMGVR